MGNLCAGTGSKGGTVFYSGEILGWLGLSKDINRDLWLVARNKNISHREIELKRQYYTLFVTNPRFLLVFERQISVRAL